VLAAGLANSRCGAESAFEFRFYPTKGNVAAHEWDARGYLSLAWPTFFGGLQKVKTLSINHHARVWNAIRQITPFDGPNRGHSTCQSPPARILTDILIEAKPHLEGWEGVGHVIAKVRHNTGV